MPLPAKKISTKPVPAKKAPAKAKVVPPKFKAPEDFRPHFVEVKFTMGKDGLIDPTTFAASRVRGKWETKENPRYDMSAYDVKTMLGIACRLSSITFVPNIAKRLPAGNRYLLVIRAAKKAVDGTLMASVKHIARAAGEGKFKWLKDVADLERRRLRRVNRCLASAFVDSQLPPKKTRGSQDSEE